MAEFPYNMIEGYGEADPVRVTVNVVSEYTQVDETALAQHIQAWLLANVPYVTSTAAERHEQLFPITQLPPA